MTYDYPVASALCAVVEHFSIQSTEHDVVTYFEIIPSPWSMEVKFHKLHICQIEQLFIGQQLRLRQVGGTEIDKIS